MKIATWNVNGIRARQSQFCAWVERDQPDVICLQELKAEPEQVPIQCAHEDYYIYWHGLRGYSGVSLHVRKGLFCAAPTFGHPDFDMESRIVHAECGDWVIASVYVPNGGKDYTAKLDFMAALAAWARATQAQGRQLILCGDINITRADVDVHPKERKPGVIGQRPEERALFDAVLGDDLVDIGRALDPDNPGLFTWWAPWRNMRQRNIGWRIDYILAAPSIAARARSCLVLTDVGTSDHAPVMLTLDLSMLSARNASRSAGTFCASPPIFGAKQGRARNRTRRSAWFVSKAESSSGQRRTCNNRSRLDHGTKSSWHSSVQRPLPADSSFSNILRPSCVTTPSAIPMCAS